MAEGGGSFSITVNDGCARYVHRFDECIVFIQQGDGGVEEEFQSIVGGRYMYVYVVS